MTFEEYDSDHGKIDYNLCWMMKFDDGIVKFLLHKGFLLNFIELSRYVKNHKNIKTYIYY